MTDDYERRSRVECERAEGRWAKAFGREYGVVAGAKPKARPGRRKDHQREARYRALVAEGKTYKWIAGVMGVKVSSVHNVLSKLGLKAARSTVTKGSRDPERDKRIREMCAAGATAKEIAADVGMTVGGVRYRCSILAVEPARIRGRRGQAKVGVRKAVLGLAHALGVDVGAVYVALKRGGIDAA